MAYLSEEARRLKREYQREYYRKHPEKQKEYNERYWAKKAREAIENETGGHDTESPSDTGDTDPA